MAFFKGERMIADVLKSSVWHVLFPIGAGNPVYVMSEASWQTKHGPVYSHQAFAGLSARLEDVLLGSAVPLEETPFGPPLRGRLTNTFPEAAALRAFANRMQRRIHVHLYQGNLYHGFTLKPIMEAEPHTAYRG